MESTHQKSPICGALSQQENAAVLLPCLTPLSQELTNNGQWARCSSSLVFVAPELGVVFTLLDDCILDGSLSTYNMSLTLPLGLQNLNYLLSGPL